MKMRILTTLLIIFSITASCQKLVFNGDVKLRPWAPPPPEEPEGLNPADESTTIHWYDVTDPASITNVAGVIQSLTDKAGSRDLDETYNNFPAYSATGGADNKAYITLNSTHTIYDDDSPANEANGIVFFAVIRMTNLTPVQVSGSYRKAIISFANREQGLLIDSVNAGYIPLVQHNGTNNDENYTNRAYTDWQVITVRATPTETYIKVNREEKGKNCKTNLTKLITTDINLGYFTYTAPFEFSELVVCDGSITAENEEGIKQYLMAKYAPDERPRFVYFGDSQTAGTCGFMVVHPYLTRTATSTELVNYGQGSTIVFPNAGSTGVAGSNFVDLYQDALTLPYQGQYLVIGYGVNDVNQGGVDATWKATYKAMINEFITAGWDPDKIVIHIPPSTATRQALMSTANTYISEIASELGIQLYDANAYIIANGGDTNFGDALHLNNQGNIYYSAGLRALLGL